MIAGAPIGGVTPMTDDPPTVPLERVPPVERVPPQFTAGRLRLRHEIRLGLVLGALGIIVMGLVLAQSFDVLTRTMLLAAGAVGILVVIAGALSAIVDRRRLRREN
jgi:hypothetical protein